MKTITIFSTKSVQVDGGLFDKDAKIIDCEECIEILETYFSRTINVAKMLGDMVKNDEKKKALLSLFLDKIKREKEGKSKDEAIKSLVKMKTQNDMKYCESHPSAKDENKVETLFKVTINNELSNPSDMDLCRRVEQWGLKDDVVKLNKDSEEWKKVEKKSTMYQIGDSDVYALHCLDEEDMDVNKNVWLPCLLNCAFALVGHPADGVRIQLVMHDAEFGRKTEYAKHNVMLIKDKAEVEREFGVVNGMLGDNDECSILFFQHTVNPVTRILNTPETDGEKVHESVKNVITSYGNLKVYKDESKNAETIEVCKKADDKLMKMIDQLK